MTSSDHSLFLYFCDTDVLLLLLNVDDIILVGSSDALLSSFIVKLNKIFATEDLEELHYFLGIESTSTADHQSLLLTQSKYALDLLTKTDMLDYKPCSTAVAHGPRVSSQDGEPLHDPRAYRSMVGSLQCLTLTRPNITFGINYASQFKHSPTDSHMLIVKRILRYIKHSLGSGITLTAGDITNISGYSDLDWAGFLDTRKSTARDCVFLGTSLISWTSKKHSIVSKSSTEAEYKALSLMESEVMWISELLKELHLSLSIPFILYCDNNGARALAANLVFHARTKHIEVYYHYVRDLLEDGIVHFTYVPSSLRLADILTNGLKLPLF
ncbi:uncharacterized protein LOC113339465 [Papaver somniferum]|uniref:uncharacterized protein LOC113339465 n=1 Tax=Papaver somniferum TaxID=3469 RepID=UPI000E6F46D0|nr:uncharacterized protein LOC113339465 [Papaver somniferum]